MDIFAGMTRDGFSVERKRFLFLGTVSAHPMGIQATADSSGCFMPSAFGSAGISVRIW